jgi:hypothetical protein
LHCVYIYVEVNTVTKTGTHMNNKLNLIKVIDT